MSMDTKAKDKVKGKDKGKAEYTMEDAQGDMKLLVREVVNLRERVERLEIDRDLRAIGRRLRKLQEWGKR